MKTVTIKRGEWIRGTDGDHINALFSGSDCDPRRCCLGFLGNACGVTDAEMRHVGLPSALYDSRFPSALMRDSGWRHGPSSKDDTGLLEDVLAAINDADIDEPTREAWIEEGFRSLGYQIEWVD